MKEQKKVTIREVAAMAGVSISSVSRYLADPKSVQPLAAYNIKNAINELKYEPNSFAQNLRRSNSNIIGVVVPHLEFFFGKASAAISDYFFERKYVTFICETNNNGDKERFFVQELLNQKAAGLIIAPCGHNTVYLQGVAKDYKNLILLDRIEDIYCDIVTTKHEENAYQITRFILENYPCDQILVLLGHETSASVRLELQGVRRAFDDMGDDFSRIRQVYNCRNMENVKLAVRRLYDGVQHGSRPAILALGGDFLEYAVMVLNQCGREALKRVDLGGFAMPNAFDKLGTTFPRVVKDPISAGITTAEVLYKKITGSKEDVQLPRIYEIKATYEFQK